MLGEHNPLHNWTLHISGVFKETEKPDIQDGKSDIEVLKADIDNRFTAKTTEHILKFREKFQGQTIFGRSDVMRVLDVNYSRLKSGACKSELHRY
ncbi:hypothetical protein AZ49_07170 [Megasphaera elsdenii 14-14]|nr:hypothetical protein AZ49_07170 [Megasphaera elsdenii 14-14]